jgi:hypothetical protein
LAGNAEVTSAHDSPAAAAAVIAAKEICWNLLLQAREAGGWRRRFYRLLGQVLDAETVEEVREAWKEIRDWKRRIPRRTAASSPAGSNR